jgi:alanine racemase
VSLPAERAGAFLTIDLDAIVANWRLLSERSAPAECAAVVKADAYGLGAAQVSAALETAGCRTFFVAHLDEGAALRPALRRDSRILVLNGAPRGTEGDFAAGKLIPVVNSLGALARWRDHAQALGERLPTVLQVDSGMSRLGLAAADVATISNTPSLLDGLSVELVMSHLACADEPDHPANELHRSAFDRFRAMLPAAPASLANSSGIFLGDGFHFDLARPGAALYGVNPTPHEANPMHGVVGLGARIIQLRDVEVGTGVGYGHAASAGRPSTLATISLGYADGWPRNAAAAAFFRNQRLPVIGRVSMDSMVVDTTECADPPREGDPVDLIGPNQSVDDVAASAGTIGYEILTRLGRRFQRRYLPAMSPPLSRSAS